MKMTYALTWLLPTALISTTALAEPQTQAPENPNWHWSGLTRIVLLQGANGKIQDRMPNLILNGKQGNWQTQVALDVYQDPTGETRLRPFAATLSRQFSGISTKTRISCGLQGAPFNTANNHYLINAIPPGISDTTAILNGGIVACDVQSDKAVSSATILKGQLYARTKTKALSRDFGTPQSAGFNALVMGGGASLTHKFNIGSLDTGFRYTYFGRGLTGFDRAQDYIYGAADFKTGNVQWDAIAEYAADRTCNIPTNHCIKTKTVNLIGQAIGPLSPHFDWRVAGGSANNQKVADAGLVFHANKRLTLQANIGYNFDNKKLYPGASATLTY